MLVLTWLVCPQPWSDKPKPGSDKPEPWSDKPKPWSDKSEPWSDKPGYPGLTNAPLHLAGSPTLQSLSAQS